MKIIQFGYRKNAPPQDMPVIDCRVIPNPYFLRHDHTALRKAVVEHPMFKILVAEGVAQLATHPVIAVGCEFGVHRSGIVAGEIAYQVGYCAIELCRGT